MRTRKALSIFKRIVHLEEGGSLGSIQMLVDPTGTSIPGDPWSAQMLVDEQAHRTVGMIFFRKEIGNGKTARATLDRILAKANKYSHWSPAEDELLLDLLVEGLACREMASTLRRTVPAIQARLKALDRLTAPTK